MQYEPSYEERGIIRSVFDEFMVSIKKTDEDGNAEVDGWKFHIDDGDKIFDAICNRLEEQGLGNHCRLEEADGVQSGLSKLIQKTRSNYATQNKPDNVVCGYGGHYIIIATGETHSQRDVVTATAKERDGYVKIFKPHQVWCEAGENGLDFGRYEIDDPRFDEMEARWPDDLPEIDHPWDPAWGMPSGCFEQLPQDMQKLFWKGQLSVVDALAYLEANLADADTAVSLPDEVTAEKSDPVDDYRRQIQAVDDEAELHREYKRVVGLGPLSNPNREEFMDIIRNRILEIRATTA